MSKKVINVFVSSRFEEFTDLREKIAEKNLKGLSEIGLTLNMLDYKNGIADSRSPAIASIEEAEKSDIFVLLLGETYGIHPNNFDKSYTYIEYETALNKGMQILAFPVGDCYDTYNEKLSDNPMFRQFQESVLRNEIHTSAPYTPSNYDIDELYNKICNSLKELIKQILNNHLKNYNNHCPYDAKILHKNQNSILRTTFDKLDKIMKYNLKNKLLTEKNKDQEITLPVILLTDKEISISDTMSYTIDTNKVNEYFINELKEKCGQKIWNNPTYRLMDIDKEQLVLGQSDYYKTLSTCDIHYYNFMKTNHNKLKKDHDYTQWFAQLEKIIVHNKFTDISASLGCSTLLVVKNQLNNKFQYYIVDNSKAKNAKDTKHVIPSFMFQPTKILTDDDDFKLQADIVPQILKEFAEELLGMRELEKINDYQELYYRMNENKVIKRLKKLLSNGKATLKILGLSLDVYRLRPEILTVLIIDDKKFNELFNKERQLSWEASTDDLNGLHIINIDDKQKYLDLIFDNNTPLVSPAAACLKLGREYVLKTYNL